jgi:hypothetical protein
LFHKPLRIATVLYAILYSLSYKIAISCDEKTGFGYNEFTNKSKNPLEKKAKKEYNKMNRYAPCKFFAKKGP